MKRVVAVTPWAASIMAAAWSFGAQQADEAALRGMREPRSAGRFHKEGEQAMWPDSLNVRFVGNWPFGPSYAVACDSARSLVFCGSGKGVYVLDISDPSSPVKLSEDIHTGGIVNGLFYENNR